MTWKYEPTRHGLSAKGIRTKSSMDADGIRSDKSQVPPKGFYPLGGGYNLMGKRGKKKAVKLFWWCSVNDAWEWFDFDEFFGEVENLIDQYIYGNLGVFSDRKEDVLNGKWDEVKSQIQEKKKKLEIDQFDVPATRSSIQFIIDKELEIYHKLDNVDGYSLEEKIRLVDDIIHTSHITGYLLEVDIPKLRQEFEEEYL